MGPHCGKKAALTNTTTWNKAQRKLAEVECKWTPGAGGGMGTGGTPGSGNTNKEDHGERQAPPISGLSGLLRQRGSGS